MKTLIAVLTLTVSSWCFAAQAHRQGPTKFQVNDGANVDAVEIDNDDAGQNALKISGGGFVMEFKTIAQFNALTPVTTGQMFLCSDCTQTTVCTSSGVLQGAWVVSVSTGQMPGGWNGMAHCR